LFATHYYELTELEQRFDGAINYTVAVSENSEGISFLHKIIKGKTDRSYGIHVAKLAGLPNSVIQRAETILQDLEKGKAKMPLNDTVGSKSTIDLFGQSVLTQLKICNVNNTSPFEALSRLMEWQKMLK
ncbi:MAG TPA: hypothetical protein VN457_01905, partial [Chlamydiales bacterium]|nr:hypothetical protein [Chlamydiales bacterium]